MKPIWIDAPAGGVPTLLRETQGERLSPSVLMLHGWSGDEKVMWVLESVLPSESNLASPRGIYPIATGGYQWSEAPASTKVGFKDFEQAVTALGITLEMLSHAHNFGGGPTLLMGFSQGAALAFAAHRAGVKAEGIIALAGFVPFGDLRGLESTPVFWGHGRKDELVPIERARQDVRRLLDAGAEVQFCEADVGHKLGIECTRGLKQWIRGRFLNDPTVE